MWYWSWNIKWTKKKNKIDNIVNLIDSGFGDITLGHSSIKKQYLILEYAPKGDLSSYIKIPERGFKEEHAKLIFNKILKGVQDIHNTGICHRDLKTQNILLDNQYNPKICDFGFATYISKNLKDWVGTAQYAAPEIYKQRPYDGVKIDIFSLGVILFNLVTGKYGFEEAKVKNNLYRLIMLKHYDIFWKKNTQVKNVSKEFKTLFEKMVSFKSLERPSIKEILDSEWMKEMKDIEKDEKKLKDLELEVYKDFLERENIIKAATQKEKKIEGNNDNNNIGGNNKSSGNDEIKYFSDDLFPQKIKPGKYMEHFFKITGNLNPVKFMNSLANKIKFKYKKICTIEEKKNKLKFKANFEEDEENNEEELDDLTEELKKLIEEENNEEKEENEDEINSIKGRECSIQIELLKNNNREYILRFLKKSGDIEEYYKYLKEIYNLVSDII